jgi:6-phosphogluconate dehydrogenase
MSTEVKADIALIDLAVMGQNLVLNMADNGFTVCAYNKTTTKVDRNQSLANICLHSVFKDERVAASHTLKGPQIKFQDLKEDKKKFTEDICKTLYASKIVSYAQGLMLREAAQHFKWNLIYGGIALMWRTAVLSQVYS